MGDDFETRITRASRAASNSVNQRRAEELAAERDGEIAEERYIRAKRVAAVMLPDVANVMRQDAAQAAVALREFSPEVVVGVYPPFRSSSRKLFESPQRYDERAQRMRLEDKRAAPYKNTGLWIVAATFREYIPESESTRHHTPDVSRFDIIALDKDGVLQKYPASTRGHTHEIWFGSAKQSASARFEREVIESVSNEQLAKSIDGSVSDHEQQPCVVRWRESLLATFKRIEHPDSGAVIPTL